MKVDSLAVHLYTSRYHLARLTVVSNMAKTNKKSSSVKNASAASSVPIHPLADRVVVKPLSAEEMGTKTPSGIIIPDTAKEKPEQGKVVAVGPGKFEEGMRVPMGVHVGDKVLFSKYGYEEVKINGVEYYVISESNILAVIN